MDDQSWNERYSSSNTPWNTGSITTPLKEYIDQLDNKHLKILIPGCGHAHEAVYLHRQGFKEVYVCDWAQLALDNFKKRVPDFPADHLLRADFFKLEIKVDRIMEQTFFCTLETPEQRAAYAEQASKILKPEGKLVGLLFEMDKKDGPPFGGNRKEYKALFDKHFHPVVIAPCYNSIKPRVGKELFIIASKKGSS